MLAALADLIVQPLQQGKTDGDKEKQAGGEIWLLRVLDTVSELEKDAKHVKRIRELEDDEKELERNAGEKRSSGRSNNWSTKSKEFCWWLR